MPHISKPKRTRLTLGQRAEVARQLQQGHNVAHIMRTFGIGRRSVSRISSNLESILQQAQNSGQALSCKSSKSSQFPVIEEKLYEFVTMARAHQMPVTCAILKTRAETLRDSAIRSCSNDAKRKKLENFTVSKGWVVKFVKRHSLRTVSFSGEGRSASAQEVSKDMAELRENLNDFAVENTCDVDKTGLSFKRLPRKTYICEFENCNSVR